MPLFSIITPVYNSEKYLLEAVQSVLQQDYKDLELILVNDFSTDRSRELCIALSRQHEFIKVIHNEKNLGVSESRNRAIRAALGQYILFLDSDDCLFAGSLAGLSNIIEEKPGVDLVIGRYSSERYHLRGDNALSQDFTFDNSAIVLDHPDGAVAHIKDLTRLAGVCWRFAMRRDFLLKQNLFFIPARIYEDQDYVARVLCLAQRFAFYDRFLYCYRARPGSITESITQSANFDNSIACLRVVFSLCQLMQNNDLSDLKKKFIYTYIKSSLLIFYGHLPGHTREEIDAFSKLIDSEMENFKMLETVFSDLDLYRFVRAHGSYYGLLLLKSYCTEKTVSLLKTRGAGDKKIYLFCADLFGKATAQMLKNEGYPVQCFLDNNKGLKGSVILELPVHSPSILLSHSKSELSQIFVLICHQRKDVFASMADQLETLGLKREQIGHQIFFE